MLAELTEELYHATVRPSLPRRLTVVGGGPDDPDDPIVVRKARMLDLDDEQPHHERTERRAIHRVVEDGDHVVVMGAGFGATTITAARAAGPTGSVEVWEAVSELTRITEEAIEINQPPADITVNNAIVGHLTAASRERFGRGEAQRPPESVPTADVWVIDVEGAEQHILSDGTPPDRVVCEVHPDEVDADAVHEMLPGDHTVHAKEPGGKSSPDDATYIATVGAKGVTQQ